MSRRHSVFRLPQNCLQELYSCDGSPRTQTAHVTRPAGDRRKQVESDNATQLGSRYHTISKHALAAARRKATMPQHPHGSFRPLPRRDSRVPWKPLQKVCKHVIKTKCSAGPSLSLGWGFIAIEFVWWTGGIDSLFALGTEVFPERELILGGGGGRQGERGWEEGYTGS